jgi:hypothetical protein
MSAARWYRSAAPQRPSCSKPRRAEGQRRHLDQRFRFVEALERSCEVLVAIEDDALLAERAGAYAVLVTTRPSWPRGERGRAHEGEPSHPPTAAWSTSCAHRSPMALYRNPA